MRGLYFEGEAHLDPREAILSLSNTLVEKGAQLHLSTEVDPEELDADVVLDCRGYSARDCCIHASLYMSCRALTITTWSAPP